MLAHLAFPPARWKRLRTNNVEERAQPREKAPQLCGAGVPVGEVA